MKIHESRDSPRNKMKTCTICRKEVISKNMARHLKVHLVNYSEIRKNMKADQDEYHNEMNIGEVVRDVMIEEDIEPQSLRDQ